MAKSIEREISQITLSGGQYKVVSSEPVSSPEPIAPQKNSPSKRSNQATARLFGLALTLVNTAPLNNTNSNHGSKEGSHSTICMPENTPAIMLMKNPGTEICLGQKVIGVVQTMPIDFNTLEAQAQDDYAQAQIERRRIENAIELANQLEPEPVIGDSHISAVTMFSFPVGSLELPTNFESTSNVTFLPVENDQTGNLDKIARILGIPQESENQSISLYLAVLSGSNTVVPIYTLNADNISRPDPANPGQLKPIIPGSILVPFNNNGIFDVGVMDFDPTQQTFVQLLNLNAQGGVTVIPARYDSNGNLVSILMMTGNSLDYAQEVPVSVGQVVTTADHVNVRDDQTGEILKNIFGQPLIFSNGAPLIIIGAEKVNIPNMNGVKGVRVLLPDGSTALVAANLVQNSGISFLGEAIPVTPTPSQGVEVVSATQFTRISQETLTELGATEGIEMSINGHRVRIYSDLPISFNNFNVEEFQYYLNLTGIFIFEDRDIEITDISKWHLSGETQQYVVTPGQPSTNPSAATDAYVDPIRNDDGSIKDIIYTSAASLNSRNRTAELDGKPIDVLDVFMSMTILRGLVTGVIMNGGAIEAVSSAIGDRIPQFIDISLDSATSHIGNSHAKTTRQVSEFGNISKKRGVNRISPKQTYSTQPKIFNRR